MLGAVIQRVTVFDTRRETVHSRTKPCADDDSYENWRKYVDPFNRVDRSEMKVVA
jgi:hypothetical protein